MFFRRRLIMFIACLIPAYAQAQGEDSLRSERDYLVIAQMLPGTYANSNQTYFEGRTKIAEERHHQALRVEIARKHEDSSHFTVQQYVDGATVATSTSDLHLHIDHDTDQVKMTLSTDRNRDRCSYVWSREATQFRAQTSANCADVLPGEFVLSDHQLWLARADVSADNPYKLHRARRFGCYADVPGVGGGRDTPYERYDNIELHDQGDSYWFDTREVPSRRLGISLFLVDWPINNYHGVFTRDSLVIYVSEDKDGEVTEHGYSFTEPDASRLGINLKWVLASCFLVPNSEATPKM